MGKKVTLENLEKPPLCPKCEKSVIDHDMGALTKDDGQTVVSTVVWWCKNCGTLLGMDLDSMDVKQSLIVKPTLKGVN
jgi:RNase P subunit RPR2